MAQSIARWIKQRLRPPLAAGEPYLTNPTPENLFDLMKKRCPVCGLSPPDWTDIDWSLDHAATDADSSQTQCARCSTTYVVDLITKTARRI